MCTVYNHIISRHGHELGSDKSELFYSGFNESGVGMGEMQRT